MHQASKENLGTIVILILLVVVVGATVIWKINENHQAAHAACNEAKSLHSTEWTVQQVSAPTTGASSRAQDVNVTVSNGAGSRTFTARLTNPYRTGLRFRWVFNTCSESDNYADSLTPVPITQ
jgi:hypothetical protein